MRVATILGTRPEAIKLAPVIKELRKSFDTVVISTGQHREMLHDVCDWFDIRPDVELGLMTPNQTLSGFLSKSLSALDTALKKTEPIAVLVQGDTTTALAGAIAAFYRSIPVGHVEAGLRTFDLRAPFPEEANRTLVSRLTTWHFAPTDRAVRALADERVPGSVWKTGNTVIDALLATAARTTEPSLPLTRSRLILITGHRRENHGDRFEAAFGAIVRLAEHYRDVDFVYPVHMNPMVQEHARRVLGNRDNLHLIAPTPYPEMVALMRQAYLILTDSGGIQEEAPSLGVPVLVMRDTTERPEAIEAGVARLVGTDPDRIVQETRRLLDNPAERDAIRRIQNPFGDGTASVLIVRHLREALGT